MRSQQDFVFHRDFNYDYPIISHAQGIYLYAEDGKNIWMPLVELLRSI